MSTNITPATKVGEMLDSYPFLEEELVRISPAFNKLKNPVLRKTVASIATLEQAAAVAGVNPAEMVNTLRKTAGLSPLENEEEEMKEYIPVADTHECGCVPVTDVVTFDADALLASGEHPLRQITAEVSKLEEGECVLVKSSFRPEPLIQNFRDQGFIVRCSSTGREGYETRIYAAE